MSDLSDVTILITSFLRPGYLMECVAGISKSIPECPVVVVDDGDCLPVEFPDGLREGNFQLITMPFDSGLSAKRNAGVRASETKYILLGCDDFDFSTPEARRGIERMVNALDDIAELDLVSGRVDNRPYEGNLEYVKGEYIKETRLHDDGAYHGDILRCDLTVNYFLARTEVLREFPWDEAIRPIGGEHGDFFLTLKEAGKKVAFVKGVNINTQPYEPLKQDPRYAAFRARAVTHGHRIFLEKRGVKEYRGF